MIKLYIADDQSLVRSCVKAIASPESDITIVGEAEDGDTALQGIKATHPDVAILDLMMPGLSSIEVAQRALRNNPNLKLLILTGNKHNTFPKRFLELGAIGYVMKEAGAEELLAAIRKVARGELHVSHDIAQELFLEKLTPQKHSPLETLSDRELEILMMVLEGYDAKYIADKLCLSSKTINSHRYRIFRKLKVDNDVELLHFALEHGLIDVAQAKNENGKEHLKSKKDKNKQEEGE